MIEQLISLEVAKLAKKKGFDITTKSFYGCDNPSSGSPNKLITISLKKEGGIQSQKGTVVYDASGQHILQKWLREIHDIHVEPYFIKSKPNLYNFEINNKRWNGIRFYKYEHALEKGLLEGLKLIE